MSLLGTWAGEPWDPKVSTLHQVFVSIYGLIFVEAPYFNEPGYQSTIGTTEGDSENNKYNATQRYKTVELAMVNALRAPSQEFVGVIKKHFLFRQEAIREMLMQWTDLNRTQGGMYKDLTSQISKLETEIAKLSWAYGRGILYGIAFMYQHNINMTYTVICRKEFKFKAAIIWILSFIYPQVNLRKEKREREIYTPQLFTE